MIHLNYRDGRPINEQVKDGLRRLVVTGALSPGEKLPSVRAMAASLAINPNTIQKAYAELEGEGYLISVPGKGSFVPEEPPGDQRRRDLLLARLEDLIAELRWLGVTTEELTARLSAGQEGGNQ